MDKRIAELRDQVRDQTRSVAIPVEYRAADPAVDPDGVAFTLRGHAAVFDRLSEDLGGFRERIKRGAFRKSLDEHQDVRALWDHNTQLVLARTKNNTLELTEDVKGLRVYAQVADTSYARDLGVLLKRGDIDQMSFGFQVGEDNWIVKRNDDGETEDVVREIVSVRRIFDVSPVAIPAYPQTDAAARGADPSTWERALEEVVKRALRSITTVPTAGPTPEELRDAATASSAEQRSQDDNKPTHVEGDALALRKARLRLFEATADPGPEAHTA